MDTHIQAATLSTVWQLGFPLCDLLHAALTLPPQNSLLLTPLMPFLSAGPIVWVAKLAQHGQFPSPLLKWLGIYSRSWSKGIGRTPQNVVQHILSDLSQHSRPGKGTLGLLKEDPKESPLLTEGSVPLLRAESAS